MNRYQNKMNREGGFTLIELLVVVAIIALLSSIALIALISARQKARNAKRLSQMTQMNTGLEVYFATHKGYPSDADDNGTPDDLAPDFTASLPVAPMPADSPVCEASFPVCGGAGQPNCVPANTYFYVPTGNSYIINGKTVWSDYNYYFCLGNDTGNFPAGIRILTPRGVR